jgi:DNA-binding transcriptional regulator YiaG
MKPEQLKMLHEFLVNADLTRDGVYADAVRKVMEVLDLTPSDICCALHVSRPTVSRWARGVTAPHELAREPLRRFALRTIEQRLA